MSRRRNQQPDPIILTLPPHPLTQKQIDITFPLMASLPVQDAAALH